VTLKGILGPEIFRSRVVVHRIFSCVLRFVFYSVKPANGLWLLIVGCWLLGWGWAWTTGGGGGGRILDYGCWVRNLGYRGGRDYGNEVDHWGGDENV
jgi:hypothetical protein